jgi:anthranilate synthase/aminodeoxychorismate synthase-like glutamine amidotransferase
MLLILDNYDSFTYNLVQYFGELGAEMKVFRNDVITVEEVKALKPERICISPGPCTPNEAGISCELIKELGSTTPILGVCLGHQSIGQVYGGDVVRADRLMHGKTSPIHHSGKNAEPFRSHTLPFAHRETRDAAGLFGNHRLDRRRGNHGTDAQGASGPRRAVPPGIHPHAGWQEAAGEFSQALTRTISMIFPRFEYHLVVRHMMDYAVT